VNGTAVTVLPATAPAVTGSRWLDPSLPCWRQTRAGHGLFAVVGCGTDLSWTDEVVGGDDAECLVWTTTRAQPERVGLAAARRPGVRAVCLAPAGQDLRRIHTAIQFAHRLAGTQANAATEGRADSRGDSAVSARAHLTSVDPPAVVDRAIRIPHLISLRYSTGSVADTVVWELIPRVAAPQWSRVPPTDQSFVEAHLSELLALRGAARTGGLAQTATGERLANILAGGPLTIRVVYRHLDLIRPLLARRPAARQRRPAAPPPSAAPAADTVIPESRLRPPG
jgi:hypothetical protein